MADCDAMIDVARDGLLWCTLPEGHSGPHEHGDILWSLKPSDLDGAGAARTARTVSGPGVHPIPKSEPHP